MNRYVVLVRGINVGLKNRISMAELKKCLEDAGFTNVRTYIASGNIILDSNKSSVEIKQQIEKILPESFNIEGNFIEVLVLSHAQLKSVVDKKPKGFGDKPLEYHSDVIFLLGTTIKEALAVFDPREGVDTIWPGEGVIYSQRLSTERTKSRLNKIIGTPVYKSMTIRNWNTTTKLLVLLEDNE